MSELMAFLAALIVVINFVAFAMYGIDKEKARCGAWRISEKALLTVAAAFGGVGAFLGMRFFRHKTQHLKFRLLVPLFMVIQIAAIGFTVYWYYGIFAG